MARRSRSESLAASTIATVQMLSSPRVSAGAPPWTASRRLFKSEVVPPWGYFFSSPGGTLTLRIGRNQRLPFARHATYLRLVQIRPFSPSIHSAKPKRCDKSVPRYCTRTSPKSISASVLAPR